MDNPRPASPRPLKPRKKRTPWFRMIFAVGFVFVLTVVALIAGGLYLVDRSGVVDVSGTIDRTLSSALAGNGGFDYLAHEIVGEDRETTSDPLLKRFAGISGVNYVPGSAPGDGTARFIVVSDDAQAPTLYEVGLEFTPGSEGEAWSMRTTVLRKIPVRHARRDAESVVVLPSFDGKDWYAVSYEKDPRVAILRNPPRELGTVRRAPGGDARLLSVPPDITKNAQNNRGFETLALHETEEGHELWSIMEANLMGEPTGTNDEGVRCRVLVYTLHDPENTRLDRELIYTTEPRPDSLLSLGRFNSVSDATALPDGSIAVLERSVTALGGYDATLFRVTETGGPDLEKERLASVKSIAGSKLPWVGNYEGVCLGPTMAELTGDESEAGRLMIFVADDNFGTDHQHGTQSLAVRVTDD